MLQFIVYLLLAVFLAGLMTGRTPELFGRKIEAPEVRLLLALLILLQPLALILGFTAATLAIPHSDRQLQSRFHGQFRRCLRIRVGVREQRFRLRRSWATTLCGGTPPAAIVLAARALPGAAGAADGRRPVWRKKRVAPESSRHAARGNADLRVHPGLDHCDPDRPAIFACALVLGPIADHLQLSSL